MEKKKIALIILGWALTLGGLAISLTQFFNKVHSKQVYKDELAEASSQAVEYVRGKYGIEAELVDIEEDSWYARNNREPSEESVIPLKANGKEFYVKSQANENGVVKADSYQWNEIEAAIAAEIGKIVPGGEAVEIYAYNMFPEDGGIFLKNCFSEYYDGGNLEELLKNSGGYVEMAFPKSEIDIEKSGLREKLRGWGMTYKLTVFDDAERAKEFSEKLRRMYEEGDDRSWSWSHDFAALYTIYAPYIDKSYAFYSEKEDEKTVSYDLHGFDGFLVRRECSREEKQDRMASWLVKYYDEGGIVSRPLSKEYRLETGYGYTAVYFPLEKFEGVDIDKIGLMWCAMESGILNNRDLARAEICGDYAVFPINSTFNSANFMLVDISGQEDYVPAYKRDKSG